MLLTVGMKSQSEIPDCGNKAELSAAVVVEAVAAVVVVDTSGIQSQKTMSMSPEWPPGIHYIYIEVKHLCEDVTAHLIKDIIE